MSEHPSLSLPKQPEPKQAKPTLAVSSKELKELLESDQKLAEFQHKINEANSQSKQLLVNTFIEQVAILDALFAKMQEIQDNFNLFAQQSIEAKRRHDERVNKTLDLLDKVIVQGY